MKGGKKGQASLFVTSGETAQAEIVVAEVKEIVDIQYKSPDDNQHNEIKREVNNLEVKFFEENPVRLLVDYSHTIPMRPYESAKVSIGLSIPIGKNIDDDLKGKINSAYEFASKYIEDKMAVEIKGIQDFIKEKKN